MTFDQRVVGKAKIPVKQYQLFLDLVKMVLLVFQCGLHDKQTVHVARH